MKDIFIDNNIAKNFCNPLDPEYKKLVSWLQMNPDNEADKPILIVSHNLLNEYFRSSIAARSSTSIPIIIDLLTRQGRLKKISKDEIEKFKKIYFSKKITNNFKSNKKDHEHIPVVLLSDRKIALTIDMGFTSDLNDFPGFSVVVSSKPGNIQYS